MAPTVLSAEIPASIARDREALVVGARPCHLACTPAAAWHPRVARSVVSAALMPSASPRRRPRHEMASRRRRPSASTKQQADRRHRRRGSSSVMRRGCRSISVFRRGHHVPAGRAVAPRNIIAFAETRVTPRGFDSCALAAALLDAQAVAGEASGALGADCLHCRTHVKSGGRALPCAGARVAVTRSEIVRASTKAGGAGATRRSRAPAMAKHRYGAALGGTWPS